ncbi:hypothetical protein scyTo_0003335 [Scyliorhinus torazame]|uniref:Peptidase M14 domain-containing protein n=1 Tax=Scyliorhinus torazame TaxID=75743 RepID=A0A401PM94_SCYTO|nr:hypothetical protein [Scyliorhinus torazame]
MRIVPVQSEAIKAQYGHGLSLTQYNKIMKVFWLFLSIAFATPHRQVTFVGHQVLRILVNSEEQLALVKSLKELKHLKLNFWKAPERTDLPIEIRVPRKHAHTVKSFLESNGITYSVMIKNLQSLADEEHVRMLFSDQRNGTNGFDYRSYHNLKEIYTWMKNLQNENPHIATLAKEATEALSSLYGTQYTYGSIIELMHESSGNSIDWSYNQGIKYAFAFEMRDEGQYGFRLPRSQIIPTAEETWLGIKKIMEHASNRLP